MTRWARGPALRTFVYAMSRLLALFSGLVLSAPAFAAPYNGEPYAGGLFMDPRLSTDFLNLQTGLRAGAEIVRGRAMLLGFVDAEFSPLPNGAHVTIAETETYVIRDAWYSVGPGAGAAYALKGPLYAAGAAGVSRAFGARGAGWVPWMDAGFRVQNSDDTYWSALYEFRPMTFEIDHRVALQLRLKVL